MEVSTVISAANWVGKMLIEEGKYLYGVKDQVLELQDELECMLGLLKESDLVAQEIDQDTDPQLFIFANKIRKIAFQAEDVVDNYILKVAFRAQGKAPSVKYACFLTNCWSLHKTGNQIDAIIKDATKANERLRRFRIKAETTATDKSTSTILSRKKMRESTHGHTTNEIVVGFEDHIKQLVEQLKDADNKTRVIGIVGTGGAGKSTLASKVFHHEDVTNYFMNKAWVCISQQWNAREVLYEILRKMGGVKDPLVERNLCEDELVGRILDFLKDKRFS